MDRALAVVNDSDADRELLSEAGSLAAGVGAELIILHVVEEDDYTDDVQRQAMRGKQTESVEGVSEEAERTARELAEAQLDADISYEVVGRIGDVPGVILDEAETRDCDHVFVAGRHRSPAGKVVFGDVPQSVILNFNGPVTVLLEGK